MMMVCAVTGAWAVPTAEVTCPSQGVLEINSKGDEALTDIEELVLWNNIWSNGWDFNKLLVIGELNQTGISKINACLDNGDGSSSFSLDLSGATITETVTSLPTNSRVTSCILPADMNVSGIVIGANLGYVYSAASSGDNYYLYVASGTTVSQITELHTNELTGTKVLNITGPGAKALKTELLAPPYSVAAANVNTPFDGSVSVTGVTAGGLQAAVEAALTADGGTKETLTSLTITGELNDADLTYISTLSGMTTLDLSGVTSTISTLTSSSLVNLTLPSNATALPTNLATGCPNVNSAYVYTYETDNLTYLDAYVKTEGSLTSLIEELKNRTVGPNDSFQWKSGNATIKISGPLNSADIAKINEQFQSSNIVDFSEATGITAATLSGYHQVVKLPAGSVMPTDTQAEAWIKNGGDLIVYSLSPNGKTISIWAKNANVISSAITGSKAIGGYSAVDYAKIVGKAGVDFSTAMTALATNNILIERDPIEYDDCKVTINLASRGTKTMSELISEAETELAKSSKTICTLIVTGELSTTDLASLDDASTATRIDLSEATLASGASVDNIQVPTTLLSLVLPPNNTVSSTLETELAKATNFEYVYSETSNNGATVPTYVWIAKTGVMAHVFANESSLTSAVYLKVAAKSGVSLDQNSVDLSETGMNSLQFLDVSESGLTTAAAPYYKAPHYNPYRIILPNNWSGDDMATFAANKNVGAIAAVYSYHGTTLKIMEINDASYSQAALADPRIMRSGTTEVDVVSGYYDGTTYAQFGTNLLAALNNMGKSSFSVTTKDANNNDVVTNYTNTLGQSVKTISIETTSAAPNALTFDNPSITTLKAENLVQNNAELNVSACSALTSLSVKGSNLKSVTASGNTSITSADLSGTAIATTTNFNGATKLATFTTTSESIFNGNVDLTSSKLSAFTSEARFGGHINFNASSSLASIDLSGATFSNNASVIHVDAETTEGESNTIISGLQKTDGIKVPSSFEGTANTRIHPYDERYVSVASSTAAEYKEEASDMTFHDKTTGDNYRYWYQGTSSDNDGIVTIGTSSERRISDIITNHGTLSSDTHAKIKVVGPLTSADITSLKDLNCTALDLSEATYGGNTEGETIGDLLKASFSNTSTLGVHSNVKFIALPDSCTRDFILNESALAGLKNSVYCVIAVNETSDGKDLTSYSFQSGSLQPAVVAFQNSAANSWTTLSTEQNATTKYTSSVGNFKKLKISGLINSYDLSKAEQKLDADGHLSWTEDVVESTDQTRTLNGAYTVYGPFSACFLLTEIDLKNAYFEPWSNQQTGGGYFTRYWVSDMTLSALNVISTATYKVVIPQDSRVNEVPADFLRCSTNIRAICIPSNIRVIRTRAFYTIDYVWTTSASGLGMEGNDPEGSNTRLDNGASLSVDGGTTFVETSALVYNKQTHKYEENPAFLDSYYTANYGTENGGGTYTFGSNLRLIETGAFANTQPNVSDVYVLNTTAPECHVDAFNTVMYTGNGGYNSAKVSSEGIITRDAYYNGRWITILHYPRQTTDPQIQRYTDPTRDYSIATSMRDGKGAILYFPNQSEFIRAYQQGTFGYTWNAWNPTRDNGGVVNGSFNGSTNEWTAELQAAANTLYINNPLNEDKKKFYSFYNVSLGGNTKPEGLVDYYKVNWNPSTYQYSEVERIDGTAGNLYPKSEKDNGSDIDGSGEKTTKDYRGWHQFVLTAYAANTVLEEEPYRSYITDNEWWTIVPEFDITRSESALLFGKYPNYTTTEPTITYPRIHKLRYVRREYSGETIYLSFTKDLATNRENRDIDAHRTGSYTRTGGNTGEITAYTNADQHGRVDGNGIIEVMADPPAGDDVVMSAGVPYLIKPNLPANGQRQYRIFKSSTDAGNYNATRTATDPVGFGSETLWAKIKFAQEMNGATQRAMVKSGTYTVPVFVSVADGENVVKEAVEMDGDTKKVFKPNDEVTGSTEYHRSTDRHYTFVGTLYKSFLPHYSYFLGWDSQNNCAKFYYHNGNFDTIDNEMRWANGTGVIVPVLAGDLSEGKFRYDVTVASDMANPAQWKLLETFADDSFKHTGGGTAKQYVMDFNAPDMIAVDDSEVTGIANVDATDNVVINGSADVYTVNGQKVGTSLEELPKGIYIVNGKKFIVK